MRLNATAALGLNGSEQMSIKHGSSFSRKGQRQGGKAETEMQFQQVTEIGSKSKRVGSWNASPMTSI